MKYLNKLVVPILSILSGCILLLSLNSCSQLSSFQTAETVGAGNLEIAGGVLAYGVNDEEGNGLGTAVLPHVKTGIKYGLSEQLDIGAKISTGGNILLEGKYQLLGASLPTAQRGLALAAGAGFEYQYANEETVLRYHIPFFASLRANEKTAFYATPRYVYQWVKEDNNAHFLGSSLGFMRSLNDNLRLSVQASYYVPFKAEETIFQLGLGVSYLIGK